jgi:hypothetical protein
MAVLLLIIVSESLSAWTTSTLVGRGWMAAIPDISPQQIDAFLADRNPALGWGPAVDASGEVIRLAPRRDPAFSAEVPPCISTYGDSFTAGSGVEDDRAYPHQLAVLLGCRVANYGIGGYGSDQAWMLFRAQQHLDTARTVIIGHVSENVLRNVNEYRQLLYPGESQALAFKPRYVLRGDSLERVDSGVATAEAIAAFERDPDRDLTFDAFRSRPRREFPFTLALLRWLATDFHVRARLAGVPRHAAFYSARHPSDALRLTTAILSAFADGAARDGRTAVALLIPVGADFLYFRRTGTWVDQPLADALAHNGVRVIHAGPLMAARLGAADPCSLFGNCSGHFNAAGYQMLAAVVAVELDRVLPPLVSRA